MTHLLNKNEVLFPTLSIFWILQIATEMARPQLARLGLCRPLSGEDGGG